MATKIYVGNLSYDTTEDQLRDTFTEIGEVDSVSLIMDRYTGRSKGFAFVEMADAAAASAAISELNGKELDGRTMTVNEAKPREDRPREGGNFGQRNGGGGRTSFSNNRSRSRF